jgi:hypothetical protein
MQRFLAIVPLALAVGFVAGCATDNSATSNASTIVSMADTPLQQATPGSHGADWVFEAGAIRGAVEESGAWNIRAEVAHKRLRCATYETGIRLGVGDASCDKVDWLTEVQYGTRQTQCNGATVIHAGRGSFDLPRSTIAPVNCVRVVVRCSGAC